MRTTLELPDDLFQRLKFRASATRQPLRQVVTEAIERGLGAATSARPGGRPPLPVIVPPTGATIPALTNEELHEIELREELKRL